MHHQPTFYQLHTTMDPISDHMLSPDERWQLLDQLVNHAQGILVGDQELSASTRSMLVKFVEQHASASVRDMNVMFRVLGIPLNLGALPTFARPARTARERRTKRLTPGASVSSGLFQDIKRVDPAFETMHITLFQATFPQFVSHQVVEQDMETITNPDPEAELEDDMDALVDRFSRLQLSEPMEALPVAPATLEDRHAHRDDRVRTIPLWGGESAEATEARGERLPPADRAAVGALVRRLEDNSLRSLDLPEAPATAPRGATVSDTAPGSDASLGHGAL